MHHTGNCTGVFGMNLETPDFVEAFQAEKQIRLP
jgi:hypothetical protein